MILKLYGELLSASLTEFKQIIESGEILYTQNGQPWKIRFYLNDKSLLDVYCSASGKYSYHWDQRVTTGKIYRHDNAPHKKWKNIKTFPKHFHDGSEDVVTDSHMPDDAAEALKKFLRYIKERMRKEEDISG